MPEEKGWEIMIRKEPSYRRDCAIQRRKMKMMRYEHLSERARRQQWDFVRSRPSLDEEAEAEMERTRMIWWRGVLCLVAVLTAWGIYIIATV